MRSNNKHIVFFDLETTGLNKEIDRIIQIGMVKVDYNGKYINRIERKFNPCGVKSTQEALEKHHISDESLVFEPTFEECADMILEFLEGCDIGGHNCIKFDVPFLLAEFERCGRTFTIEKRRIIDTRRLYLHYHEKHLEDMYREYCPDGETYVAHDALCDTNMTVCLFNAMCKEHNTTIEEIDEVCGNDTRIDIDGFFVLNKDFKVCMGKGKNVGMLVEEVDPSYFEWMIEKADHISMETKNLAARVLKYIEKVRPKSPLV